MKTTLSTLKIGHAFQVSQKPNAKQYLIKDILLNPMFFKYVCINIKTGTVVIFTDENKTVYNAYTGIPQKEKM